MQEQLTAQAEKKYKRTATKQNREAHQANLSDHRTHRQGWNQEKSGFDGKNNVEKPQRHSV